MESNGALAHREIFKFNYIHDYDVVIIGHARAHDRTIRTNARASLARHTPQSKARETTLEQGYWHAIAADECLTRQREKNGSNSKKQIKPRKCLSFYE